MKIIKNMKLTVKTIKGETFKIDVEPFNTVNYFIVMSFCRSIKLKKKFKQLNNLILNSKNLFKKEMSLMTLWLIKTV